MLIFFRVLKNFCVGEKKNCTLAASFKQLQILN